MASLDKSSDMPNPDEFLYNSHLSTLPMLAIIVRKGDAYVVVNNDTVNHTIATRKLGMRRHVSTDIHPVYMPYYTFLEGQDRYYLPHTESWKDAICGLVLELVI